MGPTACCPTASGVSPRKRNAGFEYGIKEVPLETARKITLEVPLELLEKAQRASGIGSTQTVRTGLQLVPHRGLMPVDATSEARFASRVRWHRYPPRVGSV